jgi:hypothetical protein
MTEDQVFVNSKQTSLDAVVINNPAVIHHDLPSLVVDVLRYVNEGEGATCVTMQQKP